MSDLRELYQEMILEHNKQPRNFRVMDGTAQKREGYNPLCGDRLTVYMQIEGDVIKDVSFQGTGCAIFKASASMMTMAVKGKTLDAAGRIFKAFRKMLSSEKGAAVDRDTLGKLAVFSGVCEYPVRVKCATLAWHTLRSGLNSRGDTPVSTE